MNSQTKQPTDGKIRAEHLVKFTVFENDTLHIYFIKGGSHRSFIQGLRIDGALRRTMIGVANTRTKGRWWKGEETGNVPTYCWMTNDKNNLHVFIGRLAFMFQTKRVNEA